MDQCWALLSFTHRHKDPEIQNPSNIHRHKAFQTLRERHPPLSIYLHKRRFLDIHRHTTLQTYTVMQLQDFQKHITFQTYVDRHSKQFCKCTLKHTSRKLFLTLAMGFPPKLQGLNANFCHGDLNKEWSYLSYDPLPGQSASGGYLGTKNGRLLIMNVCITTLMPWKISITSQYVKHCLIFSFVPFLLLLLCGS